MIHLTDHDFEALCVDPEMRRIIDDANRNGRRAALGFWAILIPGWLMTAAVTCWLIANGWQITGVAVGSVGMLVVYILAAIPLAMAGRAIKLPAFGIIAARHGLDYAPLVVAPPGYTEAGPVLFGDELGAESFTDFFSGKFLDACDFATCQAYVLSENNSRFNGRFFILGRRLAGTGQVIVTPDCPRLVDPATALAFDDDPAFSRAFKVHATNAAEGRALLGSEARRALIELRRRGKVRLHAGPGVIFVAVEGRKGFTPGLGFRFHRGEDRIRWMFDDLAGSLALLSRLKAALDPAP